MIRTSSRIGQNLHRETHRYLGFFSSHNVYYVKKTILLDKHRKGCYTSYADSHRGVLEYQRGGHLTDTQRYWENTGRGLRGRLTVPLRLSYIWGVRKIYLVNIIYKCNNFPLKYLPPPPKIYLTFFALPFIIRSKGEYYD